jgi:hypothetical protein
MLDFSESPLQLFSRADGFSVMVTWAVLVIIVLSDGVDSKVVDDNKMI